MPPNNAEKIISTLFEVNTSIAPDRSTARDITPKIATKTEMKMLLNEIFWFK